MCTCTCPVAEGWAWLPTAFQQRGLWSWLKPRSCSAFGMAKLREGRGGSTLKILYVCRSLLPLSWQSGLFLKQHKWKSSKLSASFSHRPQNNLRDHFFSTPIALHLSCYHGGFLSSIFEPFTDHWLIMSFSLTAGIRAGTFPRSQSQTAVPDVGCSLIFTKGRTSRLFFLPAFLYVILWHLFCPIDRQPALPIIYQSSTFCTVPICTSCLIPP